MPLDENRGECLPEPTMSRREVCKRIGLLGSAVVLAGIPRLARAMADTEKPPSGLWKK